MNTTIGYEINKEPPLERPWLAFVNRATVTRSAVVAVVIGSVLTLINQSGWIFGSDPLQVLQLVLVFLTPFAVVMVAQVAGARRAHIDTVEHGAPASLESYLDTMFSHGIPARAVVIGLIFGSLNAAITLGDTLLSSGNLAAVSVAPVGQAYVLPLLFGLLSQTISYRRIRYQAVKGDRKRAL